MPRLAPVMWVFGMFNATWVVHTFLPVRETVDRLLLFHGETPKTLESLTKTLLLFLRQMLPLIKSLSGQLPFLRCHRGPLAYPRAKSLLAFQRQLIPLIFKRAQHLLLFWA